VMLFEREIDILTLDDDQKEMGSRLHEKKNQKNVIEFCLICSLFI
jgi:hypothetical protein